MGILRPLSISSALLLTLCVPLAGWAQDGSGDSTDGDPDNGTAGPVGFSETAAIIEINATDGDIGFHTLLNADAWKEARIFGPGGENLFKGLAAGPLAEQGLTENAFESDEPLCAPDPEDPEAEVVPLSAFIERFAAGTYRFTGVTLEGETLEGTAELTYALPAAPDILGFDGTTVTWQPGTDLGRCQDDELVAEGTIADPGSVELVGWEVVVEPADDEAADPLRVFSVQLPAGAPNTVTVPAEFIEAYRSEDITEFKVEVGAIEASGNRTFSEEDFSLETPSDTSATGDNRNGNGDTEETSPDDSGESS